MTDKSTEHQEALTLKTNQTISCTNLEESFGCYIADINYSDNHYFEATIRCDYHESLSISEIRNQKLNSILGEKD
jgi:hypothetical protein